MRLTSSPSSPRRLRGRRPGRRLAAPAIAAVLALSTLAAQPAAQAKQPASSGSERATQFRVASFNILGAGHTDGSNPRMRLDVKPRRPYEKSVVRTGYVVSLLRQQNLSVVGLQEFQPTQHAEFVRLTGDAYGIYPGNNAGFHVSAMHNSIVWRKSDWNLLEARTLAIPYGFKMENGKKVVSRIKMPVLRLENRTTLQQAWFANFHNAAPSVGPQAHRDEARTLQVNLIRSLRAESPQIPVLMTGDMNETSKYFCDLSKRAPVQAAGPGGITSSGKCVAPSPIGVDWVFGTNDITFSGHQRLRTELVKRTSDHPLVLSDVSLPPQRLQGTPIRRVVAISVDGLRPSVIKKLGAKLPAINSLRTSGVSTLRAHTSAESTAGLANQASILTGRRVAKSSGGHGIKGESLKGTVHGKAGRYVSSVFDIVRNNGRSTAAYTDSATTSKLLSSWNGSHGGADPQGLDSGRNKFTVRMHHANSTKLVKSARKRLRSSPATFTYVNLTGPDRTGHRYGFAGKRYQQAVKDADSLVGRLLREIRTNSKLDGSTLVVFTSAHGGTGRSHAKRSLRANHTVPFAIWGPGLGLPGGTELFSLNPHLSGSADQLSWSTATVRNASLANVALSALRLPSIPGSSTGARQDLRWTRRPINSGVVAPPATNNGS